MDQVAGQALATFRRMAERSGRLDAAAEEKLGLAASG